MGRAYQCDRCGNVFLDNDDYSLGVVKPVSKYFSKNSSDKEAILEVKGTNLIFDICPKCKSSFIEWWHKPQFNKEEFKNEGDTTTTVSVSRG